MPESAPPPADLAGLPLAEIARLVADRKLPPVEQWHPAHCGDSRMRIAQGGTWYHDGGAIGRPALVRLFAGILRREADGSHVLVTPAEKLTIEVEDAAFVAVELASDGVRRNRRLAFRLNTDELVIAGPGHGLRIADGPRPYLHVRGGLEARIDRPVYYELAQIALEEAADPPGVWSNGAFLPLEP